MSPRSLFRAAVAAGALLSIAHAQTFQRLGGCPTLGCVFPPDQVDFLAGQYFDIRLEVHAPVNGSEATGNPNPDTNFAFTVARPGQPAVNASTFFAVAEPALERWNFTWYEDLFAQAAGTPSLVNVAAKAYRRVALYEPGEYVATLTYSNGTKTVANWLVRDLETVRKAQNVILFIGDGMTQNMITAARLIAHKSINGRYQTLMQMDKMPVLGHQMTHSLDSFITDSANSATALYSGHKTTVNALGCYKDSSANKFDDPKIESIAEMFHRIVGGAIGIVSTAFIADATPGALTAHTPDRGQYGAVVDSFLHGITNYSWTSWDGPDVLFGGGAEQFYTNQSAGVTASNTYLGRNYYDQFTSSGYALVQNNTQLQAASNSSKTLGIFTVSNMDVWLDRNVYTKNLVGNKNTPDGKGGSATDQPGLREMTLKAVDILHERSKGTGKGWFLMSEAASVDKQMHRLDYDRALGDLLELDDTVKKTMAHLTAIGEINNTLIIVTADHGHGFDVMGSVDTKYLNAQNNDRSKREAIGTYYNSGQSQYTNLNSEKGPQANASVIDHSFVYTNGTNFPANWDPRYTLFSGVSADPDRRENYQVHKDGARTPAVNITGYPSNDYFVNYKDAVSGFIVNGTLPVEDSQGVHSLTDVPVFATGPCSQKFAGVYNSIDIFFNIANCFGLARSADTASNSTQTSSTVSSQSATQSSTKSAGSQSAGSSSAASASSKVSSSSAASVGATTSSAPVSAASSSTVSPSSKSSSTVSPSSKASPVSSSSSASARATSTTASSGAPPSTSTSATKSITTQPASSSAASSATSSSNSPSYGPGYGEGYGAASWYPYHGEAGGRPEHPQDGSWGWGPKSAGGA